MKDENLATRYRSVRQTTMSICKPLQVEDFVVQPITDISPPKWHLAHTTWFFEEMILVKYSPNYKRFHSKYSLLFNSYYDSLGERTPRPDRGNMSRPTLKDLMDYRAYVDEHMLTLIPQLPLEGGRLLELGLNHEQQHQELLYTDIKYILGHNPLFPTYDKDFVEAPGHVVDKDFIAIPEDNYTIGFTGDGFSYDNEKGSHRVFLNSFQIRKGIITNEEYIAFIADGGYTVSAYWHSDAWAWLRENDIVLPLYWSKIDGVYHRYSLSGLEPINLQDPVTHITYYEAAAFAEWGNMRLPTEFEWEVASDKFKWGIRWEYTNSAYLPYPGFVKPGGAVGEYNGKFMVNQMVLRGSSVVTSEGHSRKTYRNFFHPNLGWQFTGIRLCKK